MFERSHIRDKKVWRRKQKQEHGNGELSEDIPTSFAELSNNDKSINKNGGVKIIGDDPTTQQHYTLF